MKHEFLTRIKTLICALVAAALLSGIFLALPKERRIDCRLDAALTEKADPAAQTTAALTIDGIYKSSLFGGDSFTGKLEIGGLSVTAGELLSVTFSAKEKGYGALTYKNGDSLDFIGYVRMNKTASEVIICLFDDIGGGRREWSADEGAVISYPDSIENISDKLY